MVSGLGLEPRMTGPKPVVIPFHHPELNRLTYQTPSYIYFTSIEGGCKGGLFFDGIKRSTKNRPSAFTYSVRNGLGLRLCFCQRKYRRARTGH